MKFLKYFSFYKFISFGSQNIISKDNKTFFINSGLSTVKKHIFIYKKNISYFQYCVRTNGIFNDCKNNTDGIHQIFFIMLGFYSHNNIFINFKKLFYYLKIFINIKYLFITLNLRNYEFIFIVLLFKVIKKIIFTKKNIWKINLNGYCGFSIEIYFKIKKKLLEIWNFVIINYIYYFNKLKKTKNIVIDTGLGYNRILFLLKKNCNKINYKFYDLINFIFFISNVKLINKNKALLNKFIKKIFSICFINRINFFLILIYYLKKKKFFYYKIDLYFIKKILKKKIFFFKIIKNFLIKTIFDIKKINNTYGIPMNLLYYKYKDCFK